MPPLEPHIEPESQSATARARALELERAADSEFTRLSSSEQRAARARAEGAADERRRIELLIGLLDDESAEVELEVRRELLRLAPRSFLALRRAARADNPRLRGRARRLLLLRERELAARRLVRFGLARELDLERGLMLLSRFGEPSFDARPTVAALDALAARVLERIENARPTASRARLLIECLAHEAAFTGDRDDYHHPDNIYLHRALVRRRGMPLTLTAIYLFVARRIGLRAHGVALPGHVVLRIYDREQRLLVDPFDSGKVLSERDCLAYLAAHSLPFHPRWFDDSSDATLWVRHLRNLQQSYRTRGLAREVELLANVVAAREKSR